MPKATSVNDTINFTTLHKPLPDTKNTDRKVWSVSLGSVWLPYFMAQNATGVTSIPHDVLGAPLRLAREKDGTPRFSQSGRPVLRVNKELNDQIKMVRENFAFGLMVHAEQVKAKYPEAYKAQVDAAKAAGAPLVQKDSDDLQAYLELLADAAQKAKGEDAAAPPAAEQAEAPNPVGQPERELVPA